MRIIHITESLGGGVLNVIIKLANDQIHRGENVFLIYSARQDTPSEEYLDAALSKEVKRFQITMTKEPNLKIDGQSTILINKLIKKISPDVIHAHSSKAGALARAAAFPFAKKLFYTPHGFSFSRRDISLAKRGVYWFFEALGNLMGGTIIACSPSEMKSASYLPRWRYIRLVENGVDDIACKIHNTLKPINNRLVIVSAGRLTAQKAPGNFFTLARRMPDVDFLWIGDGDIKPLPDDWPKNLAITGWIEKSEISQHLVNSDIFCMLSEWEGMPLALLEAMMIGLPSVVSDIGGCREVVENGISGFVCNSIDSAHSKLLELTKNPRMITAMGVEARKRALNHYCTKRMCDEIYDIYRN